MGLRFALGFGCSPNHASRANRRFLFFAAPKHESLQNGTSAARRQLANQKALLNRPLERAVALPFWISGCLLFAIHRIEYAALPCARLKIFALRGSLKSGRKRLMRRRGAGACPCSWQAAKRLLGQMIRMFKGSLRSAAELRSQNPIYLAKNHLAEHQMVLFFRLPINQTARVGANGAWNEAAPAAAHG